MKLSAILIYFFSAQAFAGAATAILSTQNTKQFNAQPKAPSIYDSATQVKQQNQAGQKQASMISSALNSAGQRLISSCCGSEHCASMCPVGIGLVVMGQMAAAQAGAHGQTAGQAGGTMSATDALAADNYNNGRTVGADGSGFGQTGADLAKKFAANKIPVTFDGQKFVGPDGKKLGPEDMMSASSMAAAGLSKDQVAAISAELTKANKQAEDKYKMTTPSFGFSEGGGGGAFDKSAAGAGSDPAGAGSFGAGHIEMGSMDAKAATSGLTKDYNGDPIGVSNDSIFNMMARRYQLKERQDSFFIESKAAIQK